MTKWKHSIRLYRIPLRQSSHKIFTFQNKFFLNRVLSEPVLNCEAVQNSRPARESCAQKKKPSPRNKLIARKRYTPISIYWKSGCFVSIPENQYLKEYFFALLRDRFTTGLICCGTALSRDCFTTETDPAGCRCRVPFRFYPGSRPA